MSEEKQQPLEKPKKEKKATGKTIVTQPKNALSKYEGTKEHLDQILKETDTPRNDTLVAYPQGTAVYHPSKEVTDYRRRQVHRLVLRGVPKQRIAEHLAIPLATVYNDMEAVNAELRKELQNFDYPGFVGQTLSFYDEVRNLALRLATPYDPLEAKFGIDLKGRMAALKTAIQAEDSKHAFLQRVGLFKTVAPTDPFNGIQTGRHGTYTDENDISKFLQLIAGKKPVTVEAEDTIEETEDE